MSEQDPYNLQRFVDAQNPIFTQVLSELRTGHKSSHWMWFIFPQIAGLGSSAMAQKFAITCLAEAKAYLQHPVLGPRLLECCRLINAVEDRSINQILGSPDDSKFRSSMTLFAQAEPENQIFSSSLQKYSNGDADAATLASISCEASLDGN